MLHLFAVHLGMVSSAFTKRSWNTSGLQEGDLYPHFFLPPALASSLRSQDITFPSITTPLPSMKATRESPSQFLNVSQTSGCCGWKLHWAISFDLSECGSSIFCHPVSLPIFHLSLAMRQAERPHRTKPIGE